MVLDLPTKVGNKVYDTTLLKHHDSPGQQLQPFRHFGV